MEAPLKPGRWALWLAFGVGSLSETRLGAAFQPARRAPVWFSRLGDGAPVAVPERFWLRRSSAPAAASSRTARAQFEAGESSGARPQ
jgi:hypothetical protein